MSATQELSVLDTYSRTQEDNFVPVEEWSAADQDMYELAVSQFAVDLGHWYHYGAGAELKEAQKADPVLRELRKQDPAMADELMVGQAADHYLLKLADSAQKIGETRQQEQLEAARAAQELLASQAWAHRSNPGVDRKTKIKRAVMLTVIGATLFHEIPNSLDSIKPNAPITASPTVELPSLPVTGKLLDASKSVAEVVQQNQALVKQNPRIATAAITHAQNTANTLVTDTLNNLAQNAPDSSVIARVAPEKKPVAQQILTGLSEHFKQIQSRVIQNPNASATTKLTSIEALANLELSANDPGLLNNQVAAVQPAVAPVALVDTATQAFATTGLYSSQESADLGKMYASVYSTLGTPNTVTNPVTGTAVPVEAVPITTNPPSATGAQPTTANPNTIPSAAPAKTEKPAAQAPEQAKSPEQQMVIFTQSIQTLINEAGGPNSSWPGTAAELAQLYADAAARINNPLITKEVLAAQGYQESRFNPKAGSYAGAKGISQFIDSTWGEYGKDANGVLGDVYNPQQAINAQANYMNVIASGIQAKYPTLNPTDQLRLVFLEYNGGSLVNSVGLPLFYDPSIVRANPGLYQPVDYSYLILRLVNGFNTAQGNSYLPNPDSPAPLSRDYGAPSLPVTMPAPVAAPVAPAAAPTQNQAPVAENPIDAMTSQQLAQSILNNPNFQLNGNVSGFVQADIEAAANGQPGSGGAMTSHALLKFLVQLGQNHVVQISAIQSGGAGHCGNKPKSICPQDRHYMGDAVDIDYLDNQVVQGRNDVSLEILNLAIKSLPAGSAFGQSECGPTPSLPNGDITFQDTCGHLHIQVPAGTP